MSVFKIYKYILFNSFDPGLVYLAFMNETMNVRSSRYKYGEIQYFKKNIGFQVGSIYNNVIFRVQPISLLTKSRN